MKTDIRSLNEKELCEFFEKKGFESYRGKQVYEWIWKKSSYSFSDMTNISKDLRKTLEENFVINHIKVDKIQKSSDGTIKNAVKLFDNYIVESVLIAPLTLNVLLNVVAPLAVIVFAVICPATLNAFGSASSPVL